MCVSFYGEHDCLPYASSVIKSFHMPPPVRVQYNYFLERLEMDKYIQTKFNGAVGKTIYPAENVSHICVYIN